MDRRGESRCSCQGDIIVIGWDSNSISERDGGKGREGRIQSEGREK